MITEEYTVEDTYEFSTGQRVVVRVTLSDSAPAEGYNTVLSGRCKIPRKSRLRVTARR